jgi:hypothetical protein
MAPDKKLRVNREPIKPAHALYSTKFNQSTGPSTAAFAAAVSGNRAAVSGTAGPAAARD